MYKSVERAFAWSVKSYRVHTTEFMNFAEKNKGVLSEDMLQEYEHMKTFETPSVYSKAMCYLDLVTYKATWFNLEIIAVICISYLLVSMSMYLVLPLVSLIIGNACFTYFLIYYPEKLRFLWDSKFIKLCGKHTIALLLESGLIEQQGGK